MAGPAVLIVRFGALGDVVLTTPLLRAIRRRYPDASITYVTKAAYAPLFIHDSRVARVVALAPGTSVAELADRLRHVHADYRLDLHGNLRSFLLRARLFGSWSSYRKRRLARRAFVWLGASGRTPLAPVAERYFEAARALDVRPDGEPPDVAVTSDAIGRARRIAAGRYVVLAPGAAHATKRWPPGHWCDLAAALSARGTTVVGLGTENERPLLSGAQVVDGFGSDLPLAAALLRGAQAVVANDSGLMHLGTAVGTPVVALFGPTVGHFGFLPYRGRATVLERPLPCRPCSLHGGDTCPRGHHRCMMEITPAVVAAAVERAA